MEESLGKQAGAKMLRLDEKTLSKIDKAVEEGIILGRPLELLLDLKKNYDERGFFTEGQRGLVRNIEKDYEDYPLWHKCIKRLGELYDEGMLEPSSYAFIISVISQFNERNKLSVLQYEQVAHIIRKHDSTTMPQQKK